MIYMSYSENQITGHCYAEVDTKVTVTRRPTAGYRHEEAET
jgi:hypothetical protein